MTPFSASYLPLDSPSYVESPVFWLSAGVAVMLVVGVSLLARRLEIKMTAAAVKANSLSPLQVPEKPHSPKGLFIALIIVLAVVAYIGVNLVMESIPAYSSPYHKVNENIKAKYLITEADVEVPDGISYFVVEPETGNTLTRVDATIVRDGKVLVIPYHVSIDKETGEPTLKSVTDSPAFSIAPENLLHK